MSRQSTTTINLSCHCGNFKHSLALPGTAFPLKSSICHCDTCRHVSGQLVPTFAVIPLPDRLPSVQGLKAYNKTAGLTRWFCGGCGASCWNLDGTSGDGQWEWEVPTGIVDEVLVDGVVREGVLEGLLDRVQIWLGDTKDGGAAVWVNAGTLEGMDRRMWGRESAVVGDEELGRMAGEGRKVSKKAEEEYSGEPLRAHCACGAVDLRISKDKDGRKFEAGFDACESCRKVNGFEISSWVSFPPSCVTTPDGSRVRLESGFLGHYKSSTAVHRFFCKGCGAMVFYQKEGRDYLDMGAGLLDAVEGARAGAWLSWTKYANKQVEYMEDTVDKTFGTRLEVGYQATPS